MHLLVDITAHGFGHLAQTAPVLAALRRRRPDLRLTVRSALPRERLTGRIEGDFVHVETASDFGFAMRNAVDIDLAASAERYRSAHADWPARIAADAAWMRARGVDAVLANAAYLPLAAAHAAGLPAHGLSSLNWADLFWHYLGHAPWAAPIHAEMLAAYNAADGFLRISPGLPMADFARLHPIGPIARRGEPQREPLARALGLDPAQRWVLLAMGGMPFPLPLAQWPLSKDIVWLVPGAVPAGRTDMRSVEALTLDYADLLASTDAVITKPGYGTFAEAACNGIPALYLERPDWPETEHLAAWLQQHGRGAEISRTSLLTGALEPPLQRLWALPAPPPPLATGAEEAAALICAAWPCV